MRNSPEIQNRYVALAPLDPADVGPMKIALSGESFLGPSPRFSGSSQRTP